VSTGVLPSYVTLEADQRSAALVLSRAATDNGRSSLDGAPEALRFSRAELQAQLVDEAGDA